MATEYKFNLPGPDLSADDIANLLDRVHVGRQLIVNATSASGGSVHALLGAESYGYNGHEIGHGKERYCFRPLLD